MKVVIIGGGFAGMHLAKALVKQKNMDVHLVDVNNYNFFPPLLYQVSTAFIESYNISYPFRRMFQDHKNFTFHMGSLLNVDPDEHYIITTNEKIDYDQLVLSMGCETNYFGNDALAKEALPMKSIHDAINLRNHLLLMLEKASRLPEADIYPYTTIVIAGGGPTGVEIAGMLAEMQREIIPKDYSKKVCKHIQIYLVDMDSALLRTMSEKAGKEALAVLDKMGINIKLNVAVKNYVDHKVYFSDGEIIKSHTLIWASGVKANHVPGIPASSLAKNGRIYVNEYNKVDGIEDVFCLGDQCLMQADPAYQKGHPQLAQVAIQQGNLLAQNLRHLAKQQPLEPFRYVNKGSMAIIAKYKAVVDLPKGFFKGFFAWLAWLFIHLIPIAGFRNKVKLFFSWSWSFLTNDPTLRLIIRPRKKYFTEENTRPK
ncbi:NAD(P)/FAD-dependent oxidoreductase [Arachidicoccus terrestris]|uniref:NAD(P)/FAD-dependent oxidoreductase n=1 Tax=Arachidicoccus terrestris TaxID=2875539 RepID=UPI001CC43F1F|nr:NAD(P)/FAD-dependent oxidoreductase [Arachidicoccus terrestris]UAY55901.1 NAD(P)/FAD-dependent oxidoreductase [Arachidicoccus terrestris]